MTTTRSLHLRVLAPTAVLAILALACGRREHPKPAAEPRHATAATLAPTPAPVSVLVLFAPRQVRASIGGEVVPTDHPFHHAYPAGTRLAYSFAAMDPTATVSVSIDTAVAPATGVIVADRPHLFVVDAIPGPHFPTVGRENRNFYNLSREMLTSPSPAALFQRMTDEMGCLMEWYGQARGQQLAADAHAKAFHDVGDPDAEARLEKRLAGAVMEARACTQKKPN